MEPQQTNFVPMPQQSKNKSNIWLIFLALVLLLGMAVLGYFLKKEVNKHSSTISQLQAQTEIVNSNAQVTRDSKLEPAFRPVLQQNANRECSSGSAVLFNTTTSEEKNTDGSVKKYFAVGQYFCNNGNLVLQGQLMLIAAQSTNGNSWEFTYRSSSENSTALPGYIFDTDPALYNRKFNNPQKL
jgi:hypothetical protein